MPSNIEIFPLILSTNNFIISGKFYTFTFERNAKSIYTFVVNGEKSFQL